MQEPKVIESEFFGLMSKKTGELIRVECDSARSSYQLSDSPGASIFKLPSAQALELVLHENTPSYNSTPSIPSWGRYSREELVPVKARMRLETEEVKLPAAMSFTTVEVREIPVSVAKRYAENGFNSEGLKTVTFWLALLPEGVALPDVQALEGTCVFGSSVWDRRLLLKALPVPEEYVDLFKGKPGVLLLASERQHFDC